MKLCVQFFNNKNNEGMLADLSLEEFAQLSWAFGHFDVAIRNYNDGSGGDDDDYGLAATSTNVTAQKEKLHLVVADIPRFSRDELKLLSPALTVQLLYGVVTVCGVVSNNNNNEP